MFNKLDNINTKSFKNFEMDDLGLVNCFFGINGSGKSALAQHIMQNSKNSICFDTSFVENNIALEDEKSGIKGVQLKVGNQVKVDKEISELQSKLNESETENEKLKSNLTKSRQELYSILNNQLSIAKKEFRTNKIHQKAHAEEKPEQALELWLNDIDKSSKKSYQNITELENDISRKDNTNHFLIDFISKLKGENLVELKEALEKEVNRPKSKFSESIIEWLKTGLKLHGLDDNANRKQHCLFCGNSFNPQEVESRIRSQIDLTYSKFLEDLKKKKVEVEELKSFIHENQVEDESILQIESILENLLDLINQKINNTEKSIELSTELTENFDHCYENLKLRQRNLNNQYNQLQRIKTNTENYVKNWIGTQLSNNNRCHEVKNKIDNLQDNIKKQKELIHKQQQQISNLKSQESDLSGFKEICNKEFETIGLRLKLEIAREINGYYIQESSGIPLKLEDLSEGEKRILAFMEFFYQLHEDEFNIKNSFDNIVIDDPITSLDAENSYEIIEMINNLIESIDKTGPQLFIFTNSSQAFHNIGFLSHEKVKRWNIQKNENGESQVIEVSKEDLKNHSDYYKDLFQEVASVAFENKNDLEKKHNAVFYCNKARLLFESHAYSNYNIKTATSTDKNFNALVEDYNIPDNMRKRFKTTLDILNSNSHGKSNLDLSILEDQPSDCQIQHSFRDIIGILYCKDDKHVISMLGNLLAVDKNRRQLLKKWAEQWKK